MGSLSVLEVKKGIQTVLVAPRTLSSIPSAESSHRNLHIEIGAAVVNGVRTHFCFSWTKDRDLDLS